MAPSNAALPPIAKIAMISIWIGTVLYGINCVMYGLSMFILLRGGKGAPVRWMLVVMSTILFLLCTVYVGTSLRQLLEAFVYVPADVPNYSTLYWLDLVTIPRALKGNLYATQVLALDIILIWRMYVVFMCNWRVIIFPIMLAAGCVGSAYAAAAPTSQSVDLYNGRYSSVVTSLIISAWVFGFTLNLTVTGGIVFRLWRIGRQMASLMATSSNRFASSIYVVVESGTISAVSNAVMLALFASNSPVALFGLDVASQLVALTPLLIVVQVGQAGQDRISKNHLSESASKVQDAMTFRAGVPQDSRQSLLLDTRMSYLSSSAHSADV